MNLFSIDTSTENLSFALLWQDKIVIDYNRRLKFSSSKIINYIDKTVKDIEVDFSKIDAFVIGRGPGSFMGLRISHSIIKAFSIIYKKPIIGIGSFFSMAESLKDKEKIAVIADARKNLIYSATFKRKNNRLIQEEKEKLSKLQDFIDEHKDYFFITYDKNIREQVLSAWPYINFYRKNVWPSAKNLLEIAKYYFNKNRFIKVEKLEPLYLHPKTCQIQSKKFIS